MTQHADLIITNARAITGDAARPSAEAVAVRGNRIAFVGSSAEASAWRGASTRVVDAQGCTLLPGFIDSHFHLLLGSTGLDRIALGEVGGEQVGSYADMRAQIQRYAAQHPQQEWLVSNGLTYNIIPGEALTRQHLDAIIADRPLLVFAFDHHTAWANTAALERAGILCGGACDALSEIVLGADGIATGELRERGAFDYVTQLLPPLSETNQRELVRRGLALAARNGITSVHNMDGNLAQLHLYQSFEQVGELTLRISMPYSATPETPLDALQEAVEMRATCQGDLLHAGSVKFFMDGVIESYTSPLIAPYADRTDNYGTFNFEAETFNALVDEADRLGFQCITHAIGDAAVRRTLDGYEATLHRNGQRDARHRVEHIELLHPDDLPRFAALGVVASMQPLHIPQELDHPWMARVGRERWNWSFVWQRIRKTGAHLAFGSDWPVVSMNPLAGIDAALNRAAWTDDAPPQRQRLDDIIASYTRAGAYAEFREHEKGVLRAGMLADLVLLSGDIQTTPAAEVKTLTPVMTVCDGRVVYES